MFLKLCFIFVLVVLNYEICGALKILGVFPHYAKSHFAMTGSLMRELARRGHQVDVISRFPQKKTTPNYTDIVLDSGSSIADLTYAELGKFGGVSAKFMVDRCGVRVCELLGQPNVQEVLRTRRGHYDVIVVELFVAHCYLATGRHLNAPMVGVVTSKLHDWLYEPFSSPLNPSYIPSYFSAFSQRMTFWQRLKNTFFVNYATYAVDYLLEAQVEQVEKHFGRKLSSMRELYDDVSLVLVNAHHSLNDVKPATPDVIEVGGLHVVDDQQLTPELQKWLDESTDGSILFTFGSMMQIESYPEETIKVFYQMFERIAPVRVLLKITNVSALPPGLPKNVKTAPWLPQVAVLKHKNVNLFITHGGLMGTQEAVAYKVPMVGLPIFGDQHTNIRSYVEKKIAVALNLDATLTADSLTNAVTTVLTDPTYRNNIENISALFWDRPISAMDSAVYWVEYTARRGKTLKSPATELTWWQFHLLDVYAFLLFSILTILYIAKKSLGFICFRSKRTNPQYSRTSTTELKWWQYYLFYVYGSILSSVFIIVFILQKIVDLVLIWKNSIRRFSVSKKSQ